MNYSDSPKLPSERNFGALFTAVFAALALYGYVKDWNLTGCIAWLFASGLSFSLTLYAPHLLRPFNKAWFLLGQLLGNVVSPIVLGAIFFVLLTPIAFITRLRGRDILRLKCRPLVSYWVVRDSPVASPDSFKNQF